MLVHISNSVRHHAIMSVWFMVDENAQTFCIACTVHVQCTYMLSNKQENRQKAFNLTSYVKTEVISRNVFIHQLQFDI